MQEVRPGCRVRFRIDRSARLVEAVERGSVDVAVCVTEAAATEGTPGDAGCLAGVLDIARTGQGLARPGADPATAEAAFEAVRELLR